MIARRELLAALAASTCAPAASAALRPPAGPSSLHGMWSIATGTPLERPRAFKSLVIGEAEARAYDISQRGRVIPIPGDDVGQVETEWSEADAPLSRIRGEARTSTVVDPADGRLPYSPAGRAAVGAWFARMNDVRGPEGRPTPERCLIGFVSPASAPLVYVRHTASLRQFIETPRHLLIRAEDNGDMRLVHLDPADAPPGPVRPWLGVSIGRWEGKTLVVETSRFNPSETMRALPVVLYMSPDARVVERFTRTSPDAMLYEFAVDDPAIFTQVWRGESLFQASRAPMFESACHEGNYSLPNILAGARKVECDRLATQ